jgi:hypothetical protein
MRHIRGGIGVL